MSVSKDDTDWDDDKSDSERDSRESVTDSSPESVTWDDCLMCLDSKDVTVKSAHKKFHKKVSTSCSPTKQSLWKDAQLEQIGNNHKTVWGNNYKSIKIEWDLPQDRDPSSFKVGGMMVCTNQLLHIEVATNERNIYP